jgi:hypothetical protein
MTLKQLLDYARAKDGVEIDRSYELVSGLFSQ